MPTSQMNVRIDDDIRIAGNEAFESIGWTPSQAAREVWAYAARNRRNPRKLREMRRLLEDAPAAPRPSKAMEGASMVEEFRVKMGLEPQQLEEQLSYAELKELAMRERLEERGLL